MSSRALARVLDALPFAALVLDARGRVVAVNAGARAETGRDPRGLSLSEALAAFGGMREAARALREGLESGRLAASFVVGPPASGGGASRLHLRGLARDAADEAAALVLLEPLDAHAATEATLRDLSARLDDVRRIRHEISNPLMGVMGQAETLRSRGDVGEGSRAKLESILEYCRRIRDRLGELDRLGR